MKRRLVTLGAVLGIMFFVGGAVALQAADPPAGPEQAATPSTDAPGNALCPVTTDEPIDPNFWTMYKGRKVFFCCKKCRTKFEADPAAYVANLPKIVPIDLPQQDHDAVDPDGDGHDLAGTQDQGAEAGHDEGAGHNEDADGEDHDHAEHGSGLAFVGRFHVIVIHFPIALLLTAGFFEILGAVRRKAGTDVLVRPLSGLGALSAVLAVSLGFIHAIGADYSGTLAWVFRVHQGLGVLTAILAVIAWVLVERRVRNRTPGRIMAARVLVLLAAVSVGVTGHFGGSLVFGWEFLMP